MAPFAQEAVVNGINSKDVGAFWSEWRLVSTRYRTDNQQLRFVFANPSAWETLQVVGQDFKDGAMLAKISFNTEPDQTFPPSLMPSEFNRILVMKRDSRRYPKTDGWGYAVFGRNPADEVQSEKFPVACHACHSLAKERDFVFTRAAFLEHEKRSDKDSSLQAQFIESSEVPVHLKRRLRMVGWSAPPRYKRLTMPMFKGTVWESVGTLAAYSVKDNIPYLIDHKSGAQVLYVRSAPPSDGCKESAEFFTSLGQKDLVVGTLCDGVRTATRRVQLGPPPSK